MCVCIFFIIVGDQAPGSWKRLWEEHSGCTPRSGARHYSFHQAERPRICPQRSVAGRCVLTIGVTLLRFSKGSEESNCQTA